MAEHTAGPSEPAWQNILSSVPVVCDGFFQPTEQIVKEDAAGLAVNIVSVASFPELLQVIGVLHNLLKKEIKYEDEILCDKMVYGRCSQPSELLIYFSTVLLRHIGLELHLQPSTGPKKKVLFL